MMFDLMGFVPIYFMQIEKKNLNWVLYFSFSISRYFSVEIFNISSNNEHKLHNLWNIFTEFSSFAMLLVFITVLKRTTAGGASEAIATVNGKSLIAEEEEKEARKSNW